MKRFGSLIVAAAALMPAVASAQGAPASLDALLKEVKEGYNKDANAQKAREAAFIKAKADQAKMLADAEKALAAAEARSQALEHGFQANEQKLAELEETLRTRLGNMGELFGVVRQVAGDTAANLDSSLVSAQIPGRSERVAKLGDSQSLPSIPELEHLWYALQQEMTESGKVVRFETEVVDTKGIKRKAPVVRVGTFNAVAGGEFLRFETATGALVELGRQPPERYLAAAADLEKATTGMVRFPLDPSRGAILGLLIETPSAEERVAQGGIIGYVVIGLGIFALFVALLRFLGLTFTDMKIRAQLRSKEAKTNNPVGRVLKAYQDHRNLPVEDLERKLDEVIVQESARLDRFLWVVKVVSVSAPLLGLLGTVTGMIKTFQSITLFGTGDPKLMAGGISEALVTTMLGLVVAIPLVLAHAMLSNLAKRLLDIVEEQAAGVVAEQAEARAEARTDG